MAEWDKEIEAAFRDCMSSALDEMEALDPTPARVVTLPKMTAKDLAQLIDVAPAEAFQDPTFARTILDAIRRVVNERDPYADPDQYDIQMAEYARQIDRGADLPGVYPKQKPPAPTQPQPVTFGTPMGSGLMTIIDDPLNNSYSKTMSKHFAENKQRAEWAAQEKRLQMQALKTPIKK